MMKTPAIEVAVPRPAPGAHARLSQRYVSHATRQQYSQSNGACEQADT